MVICNVEFTLERHAGCMCLQCEPGIIKRHDNGVCVCVQLAELREINSSLTRQTERLSGVERENLTLQSRLKTLEQQHVNGPTDHSEQFILVLPLSGVLVVVVWFWLQNLFQHLRLYPDPPVMHSSRGHHSSSCLVCLTHVSSSYSFIVVYTLGL